MSGRGSRSGQAPTRLVLPVVLVLTGVGAGVAAIALTALLHLVQHVGYGYTNDSFLPGVQGAAPWRRPVVMTLGGGSVGLLWWQLRTRTAPLISVAQRLRDPQAAPRVTVTAVDAALQIAVVAVGASLGREGAPRQVGASVGQWLAGRARLRAEQRRVVLACGAGAGLAAVYNVPLGATVFTLEVLLRSCRPRHALSALLSCATATGVAHLVLANHPTYQVSGVTWRSSALLFAVLIGPVAAGTGRLFLSLMALARSHPVAPRWQPLTITAAFGALGGVAIAYPQLLGNGKGLTQLALTGPPAALLLAVLLVLKPVATAACLAGGADGGLLTPALAVGATLGALAGCGWDALWPGAPLASCVLIAAAAVLASTLRAPLTALALTVELTHASPTVLAPMALAVVAAQLVCWRWRRPGATTQAGADGVAPPGGGLPGSGPGGEPAVAADR